MYEFDWSILLEEPGQLLLRGTVVTLQLMAAGLTLAALVGTATGIMRWAGGSIIRFISGAYIEFARNTPPLVQILFWYFSASFILPRPAVVFLRDFGFEFVAATFALGLYHGAFLAEVLRSGLQSVPRGQMEAARSIGLGFRQSMRYVMMPQVLRIIIPPAINEAVSLTKNTSLALAIGVTEITYQARYISTYDFRGVEALTGATLLYLIICLSLATVGNLLDARFGRKREGARTT